MARLPAVPAVELPVVGDPYALVCPEAPITQQSFKEECDINVIIERARNGMDISKLINTRVIRYGDFSNVPDYRDCLDLVNRAEGMFMQLDAKIRERFSNDPAKLIDFLQDPSNREEAVKLGILKPPEVVSTPVPPAGEPAGGTGAVKAPEK